MSSEDVKSQIDLLFSNTKVPVATTRDDLRDIIDHCQMLIESLPEEGEE